MKRAVESSVIKVFTYFFFEVDLRGFRDTASLKRLPRKDVSNAYTVLSVSVVTGNHWDIFVKVYFHCGST